MTNYQDFLNMKSHTGGDHGFDPIELPIMLHVRTGWAPGSMVETRGLGQTHQLPLIDIDHRLNLAGVVLAGGSLRDAVGATR